MKIEEGIASLVSPKMLRLRPNTIISHFKGAVIQEDQFATITELMVFNGEVLTKRQLKKIRKITHSHVKSYASILGKAFPGNIVIYPENELIKYFITRTQAVLDTDKNAHLVILDRSIAHTLKAALPQRFSSRLHTLSITRNLDDPYGRSASGKTYRAGDPPIDQQMEVIKCRLPAGSYLVPLDDSVAGMGTILALKKYADDYGIDVRTDQTIAGVKINRASIDVQHLENIPILHTNPILSSEARETFQGGQFLAIDEHKIGFQLPYMHPFSDGLGYRINRMLHSRDISYEILQLNIDYFQELGELIKRPLTLADIRRTIPSDQDFCFPRAFLRKAAKVTLHDSGGEQGGLTKIEISQLLNVGIVEYFEFAQTLIRADENRPSISTVCLDIDGTKTDLTNSHGLLVGFKGSVLESKVQQKCIELLKDCSSSTKGEKLTNSRAKKMLAKVDTENGGTATFFVNNYKDFLEAEYDGRGYESRIVKIFSDFYGIGNGHKEAYSYISKMPKAYHAFRMRVWNHDIQDIYPQQKRALEFMLNLKEHGVRIIDITAAPRIHALKTLSFLGISSKHIDELYSVEDLYDPEKMKIGIYEERDKGFILSTLMQLGLSPAESVMMGDQYHSDIKPAQDMGFHVYPIQGPQQLGKSLQYMDLMPVRSELNVTRRELATLRHN